MSKQYVTLLYMSLYSTCYLTLHVTLLYMLPYSTCYLTLYVTLLYMLPYSISILTYNVTTILVHILWTRFIKCNYFTLSWHHVIMCIISAIVTETTQKNDKEYVKLTLIFICFTAALSSAYGQIIMLEWELVKCLMRG